jgi:hypothetical protein
MSEGSLQFKVEAMQDRGRFGQLPHCHKTGLSTAEASVTGSSVGRSLCSNGAGAKWVDSLAHADDPGALPFPQRQAIEKGSADFSFGRLRKSAARCRN